MDVHTASPAPAKCITGKRFLACHVLQKENTSAIPTRRDADPKKPLAGQPVHAVFGNDR
jgi:hypothetical protein